MDLSLFFAGTSASAPSARRGMPAVLVRRGGDRILFDCGEGTQRQLTGSVGLADITDVFLTHLHADHWLGLPGMLKTFELRERDKPLTVHGPPPTKAVLERMRPIFGRPSYGLHIVELEPGQAIERDGYQVIPYPVRHRGPALGYALVEPPRPGRFDVELARRLDVPEGPAFGRLQRGEVVDGVRPDQVVGPPRPGRKIVITGDTRPTDATVVAAHRADVLVHEATFAHEDAARAAQTGHSTALQAAQVAADAEVTMLALTHISTRYGGGQLRDEARAVFPGAVVPRDFDTIDVPLPEKGEPELFHWDADRRVPATAQ
jgi:ribonuclease Z